MISTKPSSHFGTRALLNVGGVTGPRVDGTFSLYTNAGDLVLKTPVTAAPERKDYSAKYQETPQVLEGWQKGLKALLTSDDTKAKLKQFNAEDEPLSSLTVIHSGIVDSTKNLLQIWNNGVMKDADYEQGLAQPMREDSAFNTSPDFKLRLLNRMPVQLLKTLAQAARNVKAFARELTDPKAYTSLFLGRMGGGLGSATAVKTPHGHVTLLPSELQMQRTAIPHSEAKPGQVQWRILERSGATGKSLVETFVSNLNIDPSLVHEISRVMEPAMVMSREFTLDKEDKIPELLETGLFEPVSQADGKAKRLRWSDSVSNAEFAEAQAKAIRKSAKLTAQVFLQQALTGTQYFVTGGDLVKSMDGVIQRETQADNLSDRYRGASTYADLIKHYMLESRNNGPSGRKNLADVHIETVEDINPDGPILELVEQAELTQHGDLSFPVDTLKKTLGLANA